MACRETQCDDDVDLRIGFESIERCVQGRYGPITVKSRLRRDGERKSVAIHCGGCMLESVSADAFSRRGAIDEDADANFPRREGSCDREESQYEADRGNESDRSGEGDLHRRHMQAEARKIEGLDLELERPAEDVTAEMRDKH